MGFIYGFLCGVLFLPLSILAGAYYFFTYSESHKEKVRKELEQERIKEKELEVDLEDMPSALYASYLGGLRSSGNGSSGGGPNGNGLTGVGLMPEHLDPQYQFAGWISVKRIPEVDHRIIEPNFQKVNKKKNGHSSGNSGNSNSNYVGGPLDEGGPGQGITGSFGAGGLTQDPRFTYLDTQNPHLALPPYLQARFKDSKYAVVKGATMFIYENELVQECLGVITLPNYQVSVPGHQKDGHIFSKRNPIWLKYQASGGPASLASATSHHTRRSTASSENSLSSSKDYYLSMVSCIDKEDLYFTLLRCSKLKPIRSFIREIPKRDSTLFDKSAMNTLIRTIHSNEHQFQSAWLNALLGRIFLGVYKTPQIKDMVFQKMVEKLSRIRLPNFLNDMRMKSVHLGDGVPLITRPKLLALKPNGDMVMDLSLLYQGGFRAEVEAEAVVTVTKKIQPIKVSLVLVMTLIRLEGRVQVWVKPPPCNRIWYGFYHKPQVEMKIEPVVSDKHIKSNLIIKAIENKMLEAIAETMVLPNMDDIPFADTDGVGGIFGEEIQPGGTTDTTSNPIQQQQQQPQQQPQHTHPMSQHQSKTFLGTPQTHSPTMRSTTVDVTEPYHHNANSASSPRSAMDLPGDVRVRPRADSTAAPTIYKYAPGSRSHSSLGDEVMQRNYTYASNPLNNNNNGNNQAGNSQPVFNSLDDDPMRLPGEHSSHQRPIVESPEEMITRTLHVPGGCGIEVSDYGFGPSLNSTTTTSTNISAPDATPGNSNSSKTVNATSTTTTTHSWLFNRKHSNSNNDSASNSTGNNNNITNGTSNGNYNNNSSNNNGSLSPPSTIHQRRGSLDPSITLSYSTGTAMGLNPSNAQQQFPNIETVRTMEEHYSQYGITEYQPAGLEGTKVVINKEKKKLKDKLKNWEKERQERQLQQQQQNQNPMDGDRASVHSRDSGDTGSSYTANINGQWDGSNQPPSIYGYSSTNGNGSSIHNNSLMADGNNPQHKEKFSLGKILKGFRKKHTKGALSGGSSYLHPNYSSNGIGRFLHGEDDLLQQQHPLDGEGDGGSNGFMLNGEDMDEDGDGGPGESERGMGPTGSLYHGGLDLEDARAPTTSSPNALLSAYQPQFRQKFESTPNLSSLASYSNPEPSPYPQPQPRPDEVPRSSTSSDRERVMAGYGGGGASSPASSTTATLVSESLGMMLGAGGFMGGRSRSSSIQGPMINNPNRLSINSVHTVKSFNSVNGGSISPIPSPLHNSSSLEPSPGLGPEPGSRPPSLRQYIPEHQSIIQQPDPTTQCHVEPLFVNNGIPMNIHSVS
ncbi:hypothetical protein BGZ96_010537 [Linnemannia gamsii]|uniref:SMP-LTD domain-containing protein n=1 Tax=Linnemannia gamsii TaxID=64522 RepID=A0ABQ7JU63_9FUNG|nr:hypothetical protein BGZ96_010537 [Linnemannia gamsii]